MPTAVLTRPYNNGGAGANTTETTLTPALVADGASLDAVPIDPQAPRLKLLWVSDQLGITFNHAKMCAPVGADGRYFVPTYDGTRRAQPINSLIRARRLQFAKTLSLAFPGP